MVEVGGLGGGIEQDVTLDASAHPEYIRDIQDGNDQPHGEEESRWSEDGSQLKVDSPQMTVDGESQEENGSELMVDNPLEMQELRVTTENKLPGEPKEEVDDSDEEMHYSSRHNWKWRR